VGKPDTNPLTPQQVEVLHWMAHGYTTAQAAEGMRIGEKSIRQYLTAAFDRLGANNRAHAVYLAERLGLISSTPPGSQMLTYVIGDATDPHTDGPKIIAHVCNDAGMWGAGFVVALSRRWTKPEALYRFWYQHRGEHPFDLGRIQLVTIEPGLWVANMIAQRGVGRADNVPPKPAWTRGQPPRSAKTRRCTGPGLAAAWPAADGKRSNRSSNARCAQAAFRPTSTTCHDRVHLWTSRPGYRPDEAAIRDPSTRARGLGTAAAGTSRRIAGRAGSLR
jgi:DNA-binding CsgD family transcriptional regulator